MTTGNSEQLLQAAVTAASEVFGETLAAAFALGSLAHGGFAPLVSDVDVALVLTEVSAATESGIERVDLLVRERHPNDLAERLSIFWAGWDGVRHGSASFGRLPPVDRLDLIQSGRLLHGQDLRAGATPPSAAELVTSAAEFALTRFDDAYLADLRTPTRLLARGPRATTKAVLFPARFLYTLGTGRVGLNDQAAAWYAESGAAPALATAAMTWRHNGIADPARATQLLSAHLVTMYLEFLDAYIDAVRRPELADALRRLREQLAGS